MLSRRPYVISAISLTIERRRINPSINAEVNNKNLVNIYFFHSEDCSHCKSEAQLLASIEERYDNVKIYRYEIHEQKNNEIREQVQELYDIKTNGVPLTIIGNTPYSGYSEEKSDLIFIKTIEYYSKYSYIDQVGDLLQLETSSINKIDENAPSLDDFMATYGNYKLIGTIYTDNLDLSTNAIITGILSQINIVKLLSIILVFILLTQIGSQKNKLLLLAFYFGILYLFTTTYIISNELYTLIIEIITIILFMLGLLGYNKTKKRQYLYGNIFIIIAIITGYLENYFYPRYLNIFKELILLHNLTSFEKASYYINYILTIGIINFLLILIIYLLKKFIFKRIN